MSFLSGVLRPHVCLPSHVFVVVRVDFFLVVRVDFFLVWCR